MLIKKGIADCIRHFVPAWFAVNMGTGAVSILFSLFPYGEHPSVRRAIGTAVFFLNLLLFVLFIVVTIIRYVRHPDIWSAMIRHPVQSLFLGTFPMGASTLIGFATTVLHGQYHFGGRAFVFTLWGLWWIDAAISMLCCWGLVHVMITKHEHSDKQMTSVWILPVTTLIVASSGGGQLARALHPYSVPCALTTLAFAIFMVFVGVALSLMIITIYLHRLILHGFPPGIGIMSSFIPLGPTGQAGFSILIIGRSMKAFLPVAGSTSPFLGSAEIGEAVFAMCICTSFILWALATTWLGFALLGIQHVLRRTRVPFQLSFWGIIFPNGVYAMLTISLYHVLDVQFFRVWGTIYSVFTILLWMAVFGRTVTLLPHGKIFDAPYLKDFDMETKLSPSDSEKGEGESGEQTPVAD